MQIMHCLIVYSQNLSSIVLNGLDENNIHVSYTCRFKSLITELIKRCLFSLECSGISTSIINRLNSEIACPSLGMFYSTNWTQPNTRADPKSRPQAHFAFAQGSVILPFRKSCICFWSTLHSALHFSERFLYLHVL